MATRNYSDAHFHENEKSEKPLIDVHTNEVAGHHEQAAQRHQRQAPGCGTPPASRWGERVVRPTGDGDAVEQQGTRAMGEPYFVARPFFCFRSFSRVLAMAWWVGSFGHPRRRLVRTDFGDRTGAACAEHATGRRGAERRVGRCAHDTPVARGLVLPAR